MFKGFSIKFFDYKTCDVKVEEYLTDYGLSKHGFDPKISGYPTMHEFLRKAYDSHETIIITVHDGNGNMLLDNSAEYYRYIS